MRQYIYRGEDPDRFFAEFTRNISDDAYDMNIPEYDTARDDPYGIISVPKDYEDSWITGHGFYLGWQVVISSDSSRSLKGFNDTGRWIMLKEGELSSVYNGIRYFIYKNPEGAVIAETMSGEGIIADSTADYELMPLEALEKRIYGINMSGAR